MPDYSSNYTGLSGIINSVTDFDYDAKVYCNVRYYEDGYSSTAFKLEEFEHSVLLERVDDTLLLTFCNLKFVGPAGTERFVSTTMSLAL